MNISDFRRKDLLNFLTLGLENPVIKRREDKVFLIIKPESSGESKTLNSMGKEISEIR